MPLQLLSAFGIVVILLVTWAISSNRKLFPWRTVIWGMVLQFAFAIFILKTPIGLRLFQGAQVVVDQLNVHANEGAKMVFGPLATAKHCAGRLDQPKVSSSRCRWRPPSFSSRRSHRCFITGVFCKKSSPPWPG